jgi:3-hydroxy-D-aspartate aldolase
MKNEIITPALIVDLSILLNNLSYFKELSNQTNTKLSFIAHMKTLKSFTLARLCMDHGFTGVAVSRTSELFKTAEYGFKEIILSYPIVQENDFNIISKIGKDTSITLTVENTTQLELLYKFLPTNKLKIKINVEVDLGLGRLGIRNKNELELILNFIKNKNSETDVGISAYLGHSYLTNTSSQKVDLVTFAFNTLSEYKTILDCYQKNANVTVSASPIIREIINSNIANNLIIGSAILGDYNLTNYHHMNYINNSTTIRSTIISKHSNYFYLNSGWKALGRYPINIKPYDQIFAFTKDLKIPILKVNEEIAWLENSNGHNNLQIGDYVDLIPTNISAAINNYSYFYLKNKNTYSKHRIELNGLVDFN